MDDTTLLRYSRQIMLPELDIAGQEKLLDAKVLVLGMGGLGCPVALYLSATGIGELILADDDEVEISNLQRQIAHFQNSVGMNKAKSVGATLTNLNPNQRTTLIEYRMNSSDLEQRLPSIDLVIDCTDNLKSRYLVNEICWMHDKPLISGAAIRWEGHVSMFDGSVRDSPCYQCLYPEADNFDETNLNCSENGVVSPLVGIIGTTQAMEAIKVITGIGETLLGKVAYYDAKQAEWKKFSLSKATNCPICST
ncbi:MAG: HesA/MoeB/ThiF family protein [Candidatus Azotimanducaceae bacterium]